MKKLMWTVLCLFAVTPIILYGAASDKKDILFQQATIVSLMEGVYDGPLTLEELAKHGDFGIGTFNALDGEMVLLDGVFYQIKDDGVAYPARPELKTPFAAVTFFETDLTFSVDRAIGYLELTNLINSRLPTLNVPVAVRITGEFEYVKVRSVPRQLPPYMPLTKVVETQPVFEFSRVSGTLAGFRLPEYMKGLNVPGFHLHFLDKGSSRGGHLLDCVVKKAVVRLDITPELLVSLPSDTSFYSAELKDDDKGMNAVETSGR